MSTTDPTQENKMTRFSGLREQIIRALGATGGNNADKADAVIAVLEEETPALEGPRFEAAWNAAFPGLPDSIGFRESKRRVAAALRALDACQEGTPGNVRVEAAWDAAFPDIHAIGYAESQRRIAAAVAAVDAYDAEHAQEGGAAVDEAQEPAEGIQQGPEGREDETNTRGEFLSAINRAADALNDVLDLPETGAIDLINLLVNATGAALSHPTLTDRALLEKAAEGYEAENLDEILGWCSEALR